MGAIVVAAGSSTRMGRLDKVFAPLAGRPLLAHCVDALERCAPVDRIALVLSRGSLERGRELARGLGWSKVECAAGGERRQDSVRAGLAALPGAEWVIVHDGARPCVGPGDFETGLREAARTGAAIAAVPAKDTVKVVGADMTVEATPDRGTLWLVQTPQVFSARLLRQAHESVDGEVTDDAAMVERIGGSVRVFRGSYANIKVTTSEDLDIAERMLARMGAGAGA